MFSWVSNSNHNYNNNDHNNFASRISSQGLQTSPTPLMSRIIQNPQPSTIPKWQNNKIEKNGSNYISQPHRPPMTSTSQNNNMINTNNFSTHNLTQTNQYQRSPHTESTQTLDTSPRSINDRLLQLSNNEPTSAEAYNPIMHLYEILSECLRNRKW